MVKVVECVTRSDVVTAEDEDRLWDVLVMDREIKDRLLFQALLGLRLRPQLPFEVTALHGLIMLYGPPGTGKTTLARGLPYQMSTLVAGGRLRLIEVDPHGLMSPEHGRSQQHVGELLGECIPSLAEDGLPTIVLLDEVESMTVARSAASLSANPADVHRATDAVLAALDANARTHPHLLVIATSNFTDALDEAFLSRADAAIFVPLPTTEAIREILASTLREFAVIARALGELAGSAALSQVAELLSGMDGRQARKFVTEAMARRLDTVLDPGALTEADLLAAAEQWASTTTATTGRGVRHVAA